MGKIIQACSALLEASYFEAVPVALFERWREMAADAREEHDKMHKELVALRSRLEAADKERLQDAARLECAYRDRAELSQELEATRAQLDAAIGHVSNFVAIASKMPRTKDVASAWLSADAFARVPTAAGEAKPDSPRCYNTACRFYGQPHATAHEPPDKPEPERAGHAFRSAFPVSGWCAVCGLPPSEHTK